MANSLRAKLSKLRHDRHITDEEYRAFIKKLDGHDKQIRADAIEELTKGVLEELKECAEDWKYYFDEDNYSLVSTVILTKAEQLKEQKE